MKVLGHHTADSSCLVGTGGTGDVDFGDGYENGLTDGNGMGSGSGQLAAPQPGDGSGCGDYFFGRLLTDEPLTMSPDGLWLRRRRLQETGDGFGAGHGNWQGDGHASLGTQ